MSTKNKTNTAALVRILFLLISIMLLFGACASTNRMMRIAPFGGDEVKDPDRVALWPLLYHSHDRTSVLWPLFDMDDQGFALRPLVAVEGDSVSLLGPIAGWDRDKNTWWVTPAYKLEKGYGVFPLFGMGEKASYIGPAYWLKDEHGKQVNGFGFFPLGYYGQKWGHFGPAYWLKDPYGESIKRFGLFPLGYYGQKWGHLGPTYWLKDPYGESIKGFGLFPLGYYGHKGGYFGTAWWSFDEQKSLKKGGLFPLFTLGTTVEQFGPVFWDNDNNKNTNFLTVLPLFHYRNNRDTFRFITPLGGRGWSSDKNTRFTNILGPIFHMHRCGEEKTTDVLWPIFHAKTGPNASSTRLFPLFSRNVQGSTKKTNVLWPIFHSETAPYMSSTALFPLYSRKKQNNRTTTSILLGTFKNMREGERRHLRLWPIFSDSDIGLKPDLLDFLTFYSNLRDYNASRVQIGTALLFGMTRDRAGEVTNWNAVLGALRYRKEHESEKFNVLWYLYRMNKEGKTTNRDIFPFITWDTAPDNSRVSFLSRVFSYERTRKGKRLHLFFIPLWNSSSG